MPIYEYICEDCGEHHERIVMNGKTKVACPKCASAKQAMQLSAFASPAKSSAGSSPKSTGHGGSCTRCNCH